MWLELTGVSRSFGNRTLFQGVDLRVGSGDRIGLVGPNGAGKTTLLRIAAGDDPPDAGRRQVARDGRVGMLRQEIDPHPTHTVMEETLTALAELGALERELRALEHRMAEAGEVDPAVAERYDALHDRFVREDGFSREARAERVLEGLGFDGEARGRALREFSGGWLMRVELAKLLLSDPDVLLLDEPTNHLDLPSIQWFEETLAGFRGGVVVISHDRTFLRRHTNRIAELAHGRFATYACGYDAYLAQREQRQLELLARKKSQDKQIAETEKFIERFRYKASKARQVQSRVKALEKIERIEVDEPRARRMRLRIPEPKRAGAVPVELEGIHKAYDDHVVYAGVDLSVRRCERLALAGPNGAGKTTLLRILAGTLPFEKGVRRLGHQVEIGFYAQHQLEDLDESRTVLSELERVATHDDVPRLRGHLGAFLFSGDDVEKRVSVLSGGEKARLALAKMLLRPKNLLVLDEPTNHLDVEACQVLEDALRAYTGTLVFISHDRAFINALATRVVEVRDGTLREFLGNYDAYVEATSPTSPAGPAGAPQAPDSTGARAAPAAPPRTKAQRAQDRARRKARERIGRRIGKLEAAILEQETACEALGWKLGDPGVYADAERVARIESERAALRAGVAADYREWERLAAELEVLDAAGD